MREGRAHLYRMTSLDQGLRQGGGVWSNPHLLGTVVGAEKKYLHDRAAARPGRATTIVCQPSRRSSHLNKGVGIQRRYQTHWYSYLTYLSTLYGKTWSFQIPTMSKPLTSLRTPLWERGVLPNPHEVEAAQRAAHAVVGVGVGDRRTSLGLRIEPDEVLGAPECAPAFRQHDPHAFP